MMPKPMTNAQRAFREGLRMKIKEFRHETDAPFALIGKAVSRRLRTGGPITADTLAAELADMRQDTNATEVDLALKTLGCA